MSFNVNKSQIMSYYVSLLWKNGLHNSESSKIILFITTQLNTHSVPK